MSLKYIFSNYKIQLIYISPSPSCSDNRDRTEEVPANFEITSPAAPSSRGESTAAAGAGAAATRESAFIHAITSAGIVHTLTKNCSSGDFDNCGCDSKMTRRRKQQFCLPQKTWISNLVFVFLYRIRLEVGWLQRQLPLRQPGGPAVPGHLGAGFKPRLGRQPPQQQGGKSGKWSL